MNKYVLAVLPVLSLFLIAPSLADEFFSWVWMPCMYHWQKIGQILPIIAIELQGKLEGEDFNNRMGNEKVVKGLPPEERAEAYEYLRNECTGGHVASDYLPKWQVGKPPF